MGCKDNHSEVKTISVYVSPTGLTTIAGFGATELVQYCPDAYATTCAPNIQITPLHSSENVATFQLDMSAVSQNQNAFNFKNGDAWLIFSVPESSLAISGNVNAKTGTGGAHFEYVAGSVVGVAVSLTGLTTITGFGATELVQYCPDAYAATCAPNIQITPLHSSENAVTFQLDMSAVAQNQNAFNFKKGATWLMFSVPDSGLAISGNVNTKTGTGGAHFEYVN